TALHPNAARFFLRAHIQATMDPPRESQFASGSSLQSVVDVRQAPLPYHLPVIHHHLPAAVGSHQAQTHIPVLLSAWHALRSPGLSSREGGGGRLDGIGGLIATRRHASAEVSESGQHPSDQHAPHDPSRGSSIQIGYRIS